MKRRAFLAGAGAVIGMFESQVMAGSRGMTKQVTLLSAPLELGGEWGGSLPNDASAVIARMREACLSDVRLLSDRQPQKLRVDDHSTGPPHVWLHDENPDTAWIVVDIAARHWAQLAYQFGHELGHVLCNSWLPKARLEPPSRWLEEAMVEAFSIRGLALLADSWERHPPFPHDAAYADAIRRYRTDLMEKYRKGAGPEGEADSATWFRADRGALDHAHGLNKIEGPAILGILAELEANRDCVADMGAVNRWPALSAVPLEEYLRLWQKSCAELAAPGILPPRIRQVLGLGG